MVAATQPVIPAPVTWTAGEIVRAGRLRADISDAIALLSRPPMFAGQQTTTAQSITNSTTTAVTIDTELADPWNGHQISTDPTQYFAMLPGWYLAECSLPLNYSGGTGAVTAELGGVQNGGSATFFGGQRAPNNSGRTTVVTAAKLMQMASTGVFGSGDYIQAGLFQSSGSSQPLANTTSPTVKCPWLGIRWLAALSGTAGLAVPANPAWPVPPSLVTAAFLNASVRDAIRFLIYRPIMEVDQQGLSQTLASQAVLPTTTGTVITLTSVGLTSTVVDNYSAWTPASNIWTAPVAGVYYAYGQVGLTAAAGGDALAAGLTVHSANYNSGTAQTIWGGTQSVIASQVNCANVRRRLRLAAGDTIQLAGFYNDSGSASATINNSGAWTPRLIVVWEGS
jgi:hypothetical protein